MKKLIYSAAILALAFLAGSCQRENLEPVAANGTVTYTVQVPGAIATKADDGVNNVDKLVYEVYRTAGEKVTAFSGADHCLYHREAEVKDGKAEIALEFVNDQNFTVLFWAYDSSTNVYDVDDLTNVTIASTAAANTHETAAFTGVDFVVNCVSEQGGDVKLTRPVAQLNIATTPESLEMDDTDITVSESYVKVYGLSTSFNVAKQEAGDATGDVTYTQAAVLGGTVTVAAKDYPCLAMNYLGFIPTAGASVKVDYLLKTSEGDIDNTISNVPVKPNYKTNIIGNLISATDNYQVTLGAWGTPDTNVEVVAVSTAQDLQEAIENIQAGAEGNIILEGNIDLGALAGMISTKAAAPTYGLLIPADKSLVLDLNGNTLAQTVNCTASYSMIENHGSLTIIDSKGEGKISFKDSGAGDSNFGWGSYTISNNGNLVVNDGTIEHTGEQNTPSNVVHMYCAIQQNNANAVTTINGGTISTPTYRSIRINRGSANFKGGVMDGQVWVQPFAEGIVLNIEGGSFEPNGGDGSSVFVTNDAKAVDFAVTGGFFATKISCSVPANLAGTVTGGTFTASASENTPAALYEGYRFVQDGENFILESLPAVAKIGETGYWSLKAAVAAVQDGETITLVADEVFTETNRYNNGDYWDGLGYSGDKSFTIDLGGHTIKQDGSLNDYLIWIKNDGEKANTITFKNGTMDAGTTAYSALATASSNAQKMTVNLENINLINNISNGAVVKARGGSVLNVKAGTVITGKDSYVGIEAVGNNTVVNVYEGAEIYQNGTTSYVGAIIGASYNATLNIYGGKGTSAKCGIIVMTTGATINVSGGEWTANGDGTVAAGNNGVLVSQNNRYESGWACKSVLNVTGGTFKGGYDCWGSGPGQEPDDAQINITGGNFNANPENYVVAGYEVTENAGTYTVDKPAALKELEAALANGGNVTLTKDVTLLESIKVENKVVVLDLNGKTITAPTSSAFEVKTGGDLTIKNGNIVAYESTVRAIGGKVVVESGEYTSTGTAVDSPSTYRYSLDSREGGELIINGGTFKSTNGMINVGSTVTINGGKFENIVEKTMTRHFAYVSALLTINDGEFYGKANPSAGGCFFCGAAETGNIQVNGGKFTSLWTSGSVNKIFESYYGGTINVTGGLFNTDGGIATFVTENTDEATKAAYPYVAK